MALDASYIRTLSEELSSLLCGARIDKIHQPAKDDILIALRGPNVKGKKLLLSANASFPRVYLTSAARENPQVAPMFCMLLRKYLTNGKIISVTAPQEERIIDIKIEASDEMGVPCTRILTCEIMARHSNIILRDGEDRIIDCLKRVDFAISEKRQVLPGLFYELPPKQNKKNPREFSRAELFDMICAEKDEVQGEKWILSTFSGFSPLVCRELMYRSCGDVTRVMSDLSLSEREKLASEIFGISNEKTSPCIVFDGRRPYEFSYFPITQYGNLFRMEERSGFSDTLAEFYEEREKSAAMAAASHGTLQVVKNALLRTTRKLALQKEELEKARNRETLREHAELISANIYRLEKGMTSFSAINYFNENEEITLKLDARLTPQQNSEKLFKEYRRMKNAEKYLTEQIESGEEEIIYLESVIESIDRADSEATLSEIREELSEMGYLDRSKQNQKKKVRALAPYRFVSSDGFVIYAGKNNKQNDMLTLKSAMKSDLWLHTKNIPGSHVIIECAGKELPDRTITEAAIIAATHSRAKSSVNVAVDYTYVKFVKKPQGAAPGRVIYTNYYTAYATPDEELCKKLSENNII